jgi:peptide-methionine (S)-S-oxide reductase
VIAVGKNKQSMIAVGILWLGSALLILLMGGCGHQEKEAMAEEKKHGEPSATPGETATLGGGCFWCLEPVFEELDGVEKVEVGYSGGSVANPTYEQVCSGTTSHAEVVRITFNPDIVPFRKILEVFFSVHDPTTLNRQGADAGTQYRSIILYHDESQKQEAEKIIAEINASKKWDGPVVTQVEPFEAFYKAEDYHQEYFRDNPNQGYCRIVISPKLKKFRRDYATLLKSQLDSSE